MKTLLGLLDFAANQFETVPLASRSYWLARITDTLHEIAVEQNRMHQQLIGHRNHG